MLRFAPVCVLTLASVATLISTAFASPNAPAVGTAAPDFNLMSNEGHLTSLKDFKGKWTVLYFYPKDFTGGCTLEAHNFQRDLAQYEKANAVVVGVSVDTADSHKSFCAKEGLAFKLLSDPGAKVSALYGSVLDHDGAKYSARNTFLIDPEGKIVKTFLGVQPAKHSEEVLAALGEFQKR
jgi:thioredoxin-dependent peroxiredoxin